MAPFGVPAWSRGPVVPSGPVARPQPGLKSLLGGSRIGGPVAPFGVPAWSRGPVVPSGPVARPQPGLKSLLGGSRIGGPEAPFGVPARSRGPVVPSGLSLSSSLFLLFGVHAPVSSVLIIGRPIQNRFPGGPLRCARVVPWSPGPVWPPSGNVPRPQLGLGRGPPDPESMARETPSVCPRGPVVPWPRLATRLVPSLA